MNANRTNQPVVERSVRVVRVTRTPLLIVVAIAGTGPMVFSGIVFLFAPIPDIAKYIVGGLPWVFVLMVWSQFWSKVRSESLSDATNDRNLMDGG